MPIRFRCSYCNRLLGIATRKAGTQTKCPHCGYEITVPPSDADPKGDERVNLDDVAELLGDAAPASPSSAPAKATPAGVRVAEASRVEPPKHTAAAVTKTPTSAPATAPVHATPPITKPQTRSPEERPLFERDVDEILGAKPGQDEPTKAKPPATSGMDALSLGDQAQARLTGRKATLLVVVVVILLALAFAAGVFLSPKG